MKKIFTILTIAGTVLFSATANAQIANPYLDSTSTWHEIDYQSGSGISSKNYNKYFIDGDTIIANKSYYKLYRDQIDSTWNSSSGTGTTLAVNYSNHLYIGSLREDSTKRFYMHQNSSERLFYDFNLSIGDTLSNMNANSSCSNSLITVSYIDTIYVGSRALKKFHLSSGKTMYEGIGASYGLFWSYALCPGTVIESSVCLIAYKNGLDSLYINCGSGTIWRSEAHTICTGQSLIVGTHTYTVSGTYKDTLTSQQGSDIILTSYLTVNSFLLPPVTVNSQTICAGQSVTVSTHTYTASGTYNDTLTAFNGCDSIILTTINTNSIDTSITRVGNVLTASATGVSYQWLDCSNNNSSISGAINQSYAPSINGNYAVAITKNSCLDTSACIPVNPVGIDNIRINNNQITIYPNPTTGELYVLFQQQITAGNIKITDVKGQTILEKNNLTGKQFIFNMDSNANGIYFIECTQNGILTRTKFLKQ